MTSTGFAWAAPGAKWLMWTFSTDFDRGLHGNWLVWVWTGESGNDLAVSTVVEQFLLALSENFAQGSARSASLCSEAAAQLEGAQTTRAAVIVMVLTVRRDAGRQKAPSPQDRQHGQDECERESTPNMRLASPYLERTSRVVRLASNTIPFECRS